MEEIRELREIDMRLHALALLRGVLQDDVLAHLLRFLDEPGEDEAERVDRYCRFVQALYEQGGDLGAHLLRRVLESENAAMKNKAAGRPLPGPMEAALMAELETFSMVSRLEPHVVAEAAASNQPLPNWMNTPQDFAEVYERRLREVATHGYGIFAVYHMFTVGRDGALQPVEHPDPQRLEELTGYERERQQVLLNTKALLRGLAANNILLYGDAGTGKSSTVKALANEYRNEGLRLVEVRKNQLYEIPHLMDKLAENPLKFILFIDDLSFPADDAEFTQLKAILEGNVSARPRNIVVYATSNRRHMVKERHSDRRGDELHLGDTLEEEASLAARFGITVTFLKPDRELYAKIVCGLADEYDVKMSREELVKKAEAHAIRYGGRSPRTARQFVEHMKAAETE